MNYKLFISLADKDFRRLVGATVLVAYTIDFCKPLLWQNIPFEVLNMPEWYTLYDRYSVNGETDGLGSLYDLVLTAARKIWILSADEGN